MYSINSLYIPILSHVPSRLSPSPKDLDVDATQEQAMKGRAAGKCGVFTAPKTGIYPVNIEKYVEQPCFFGENHP